MSSCGARSKCIVPGCGNVYCKAIVKNPHIRFHKVPKNIQLKEQWAHVCGKSLEKFTGFICSNHFKKNDYERGLAEALGESSKPRLKCTAIPSLHLPISDDLNANKENTELSDIIFTQSSLDKENIESGHTIFKQSSPTHDENPLLNTCYKNAITQTEEHFCDIINMRLNCVTKKFEESEESRKNLEIELNKFKVKYEAAITELNATNSEIIELKNNNNQLRCYKDAITQTEEHFCDIINIRLNCVTKKFEESEESRKNLEIELNEFKAKYEAAITELNATNSEIIELKNNNNRLNSCLNKLLTQCQIDIALNKKKYVIWSKDDISRAFALRYYSQQGYRYLKEKLHYPLPGISSLQRWASTINMRQGILKDVLHLMKIKGESLSEIEKVTVLNFDEMKVNALYEYDRKYDEIIGPHQYMHIAMVRSLFGNWKQPVYVQFDTKMTETIIYQIIKELNDISYSVVAIVSDCGGGNVGLWKTLGISTGKTYFPHPITKENVYVFADAPHILKLIRNWLLDTGFVLADKTIITAEPLRCLIAETNSEINSCHKLTNGHVYCEKIKRQNVALAAQLLSHTTATALKQYRPGLDNKVAIDTANFIEQISQWWDLMNSYVTGGKVDCKKPYGLNINVQNEVLDTVYNMINAMRCQSKKVLQIFQKGLLISIASLKQLYVEMKLKYGISYIATYKLNQDGLENFFSQVRGKGGSNEHPTPLDAQYRIRMIILGKNPGVVQKNRNVHEAVHDEYMSSSVIKASGIPIPECDEKTDEPSDYEEKPFEVQSLSTISSITHCDYNVMTVNIKCDSEADGLLYLAGWLARKYKTKYPTLGCYTYESNIEHNYVFPNWLQHISYGGLTQPSTEWLNQVKKMDKYFCKFHKDGLQKGPAVVKNLTMAIVKKKNIDIPEELVRAFILQRTYVRIKFYNTAKKNRKHVGNKRKADDNERRVANKYKKIIN